VPTSTKSAEEIQEDLLTQGRSPENQHVQYVRLYPKSVTIESTPSPSALGGLDPYSLAPSDWQLFAELRVAGRPSSISGPHGAAWRAAVTSAVTLARIEPPAGKRFFVRITFATPRQTTRSAFWDIDNLVKPTLDAMTGIFGARRWTGLPQAADDQVDGLYAERREVQAGEASGAEIAIFVRNAATEPAIAVRTKRLKQSARPSLFGASVVRQAILRHLFEPPARAVHVRELARRIGHDPGAVSRELGRLQHSGLVVSEWIGRSRTYRASSTVLARDVQRLLKRVPSSAAERQSSLARDAEPVARRTAGTL